MTLLALILCASAATSSVPITHEMQMLVDAEHILKQLNRPPDCSRAYPSIKQIWPPSSTRLVPITIKGVTDPDGDPIKITSIFQDEPVTGQCTGDLSPDGFGIDTNTARVRAERGTKGNGRVYTIGFTAQDVKGAICRNYVAVSVPRAIQPYLLCTDDGAKYDSTQKSSSLLPK